MNKALREIETREDVNHLVIRFYSKVREDELIGPIFNTIIAEEKWPHHFEKLTDFWETNLFGKIVYKGNPMLKHAMADQKMAKSFSQEHFGRWLQLWFETIDEYFKGEKALKAKTSARKMSTGIFLHIDKSR